VSVRPDLVACWLYRLDAAGHPEILLIRRAPDRVYPGLWQCVTGKLEDGETILDGALREVAEETGLRRSDLSDVMDTDIVNWFHAADLDTILCEAVFAARVPPGARITLSSEHDDQRWLPAEEAKELVVWPAYERAIDFIGWVLAHPAKAGAYRLG
jgi:dihydroneopterin triphosphate diphosphatase